ncbi:MAG: hypothetical protein DI551_07935 [Micavibrio aeruginosavorus]|uniref:Uncharacterized protein n=1 Tax=Micavibrio aeruginosavorus TaxID=349221 RepID=A0A2W5MYK6_9BACT|nr:MAG: hypothetical protein DI551_07935 [Micavibrio aeruginosavorus]
MGDIAIVAFLALAYWIYLKRKSSSEPLPRPQSYSISDKNILSDEVHEWAKGAIKGYKFYPTLQFRTPLELLKLHEKTYATNRDIPSLLSMGYSKEEQIMHGFWSPVMSKDTFERCASQFGAVAFSDALPLLIAYREIVESELLPADKFFRLQSLGGAGSPAGWDSKIRYALGDKYLHLGEYWAVQELGTVKGIGPVKAKRLIAQGIYTPSMIP